MLEVRTVFYGKASKTWQLFFCRDDGTWINRKVSDDVALHTLHNLRRAVYWFVKDEDELSIKYKFISRKATT